MTHDVVPTVMVDERACSFYTILVATLRFADITHWPSMLHRPQATDTCWPVFLFDLDIIIYLKVPLKCMYLALVCTCQQRCKKHTFLRDVLVLLEVTQSSLAHVLIMKKKEWSFLFVLVDVSIWLGREGERKPCRNTLVGLSKIVVQARRRVRKNTPGAKQHVSRNRAQ